MAKARGARKKVARHRPAKQDAVLVEQLKLIGARLDELSNTIRTLHEFDRARRTAAESAHGMGPAIAAAPAVGAAAPVTIEFTKKSGPSHVRIKMRDTGHLSLAPGATSGKSDPRRPGEEVEASIEVFGNPGDVAVIEAKNARPRTIKLAAAPGETGEVGTVPYKVLG